MDGLTSTSCLVGVEASNSPRITALRGPDVKLEILSRGTHRFVGTNLQQLCMEAALQCI